MDRQASDTFVATVSGLCRIELGETLRNREVDDEETVEPTV
jgi:hypothetical protein